MTDVSRVKTIDAVVSFKQRLGLFMCALYAVVYAGFVAISIYDVTLMDTIMPFGLNLAAFYGLGLIVFALILSMIYSRACAAKERGIGPTADNTAPIKESTSV